jgi:hypothetical protein
VPIQHASLEEDINGTLSRNGQLIFVVGENGADKDIDDPRT